MTRTTDGRRLDSARAAGSIRILARSAVCGRLRCSVRGHLKTRTAAAAAAVRVKFHDVPTGRVQLLRRRAAVAHTHIRFGAARARSRVSARTPSMGELVCVCVRISSLVRGTCAVLLLYSIRTVFGYVIMVRRRTMHARGVDGREGKCAGYRPHG